MTQDSQAVHYSLLVQIIHGQNGWHWIELETKSRGRVPTHDPIGSWQGLEIPEEVITKAQLAMALAFSEHVCTRYGVEGELPFKWAGEPDPF